MYKILVITTKGCEACEIAINNIKEAISQADADIEIETKDFKEVPKDFIKRNGIKDFPAIFYLTSSIVKFKCIGTYPVAVFLRWIDIHFKK